MNQINNHVAFKPEKIEVYEVDAYEIEEVIEEVFGRDFRIAADMETGGTNECFPVDGDVDDYAAAEILGWQETGDGSFLTMAIMNELVKRGVIPAGQYLIWV